MIRLADLIVASMDEASWHLPKREGVNSNSPPGQIALDSQTRLVGSFTLTISDAFIVEDSYKVYKYQVMHETAETESRRA